MKKECIFLQITYIKDSLLHITKRGKKDDLKFLNFYFSNILNNDKINELYR